VQKLQELKLLAQALNQGQASVIKEIASNVNAINSRKHSLLAHNVESQPALLVCISLLIIDPIYNHA
jgi:hypothetical protein